MISLESSNRFSLVKYSGTCADELFVELPLMVAPVPALSVQRLQPLAAHVYPLKRAHRSHHLSALTEELHGAQRDLWLGREMQAVIRVIEGLERDGAHD